MHEEKQAVCNTPPSCARERIDEREREKMIWTQRAARFISKCAIKLPTIVGLVARLFVASHKTKKKKREREKKEKKSPGKSVRAKRIYESENSSSDEEGTFLSCLVYGNFVAGTKE